MECFPSSDSAICSKPRTLVSESYFHFSLHLYPSLPVLTYLVSRLVILGYRSPPRDDDSNTRRARDTWEAPTSTRNRPSSPRSPDRAPARRDDVYIPADSVPQRRARDLVSPERGMDVEAKRRRVDDYPGEPPLRRPPPADRNSSALPDRPMSDLTISEEPRAYSLCNCTVVAIVF